MPYFYASTLHRNGEHRRAVRVLEDYLDQNLEAVLLASQCLAELENGKKPVSCCTKHHGCH
jgi:hypothetical protein